MKGGELSSDQIAQIPALAVNINKDIIQQMYLNIELLKYLNETIQIDSLSDIMINYQVLYVDICKNILKIDCENPKEFKSNCGFDNEKEQRLFDMLKFKDVHKE